MEKTKVLIVESDPTAALSMAVALERCGLSVSGMAEDLREAMDLSQSLLPDLVVLDARIADYRNGHRQAVLLRHALRVPVCFVQGYETMGAPARVQPEPVGYVAKPLEPEQLLVSCGRTEFPRKARP